MHECLTLLPRHSYVTMWHVQDCYCRCWHVVAVIGIAMGACMIALAASVFTNNALLNNHGYIAQH